MSEHPIITNRSDLEYRLVYSIIVAGKSQRFADSAIKRLFPDGTRPFERIRLAIERGMLGQLLRDARTGNYSKLERALFELAYTDHLIDLTTCTPEELESFHGIGPKTARFFILWTRPDARYAALDVHVLRWMALQGYRVPTATPSNTNNYRYIEQLFIAEADIRGVTPRQLDHAIWVEGAGHHERNEQTAALVRPLKGASTL